MIYRRTKNLRAVQLLLGHSKLESTVRYLGIEVLRGALSFLRWVFYQPHPRALAKSRKRAAAHISLGRSCPWQPIPLGFMMLAHSLAT